MKLLDDAPFQRPADLPPELVKDDPLEVTPAVT